MESIVSITINNWPLDKPIPHFEINCIPAQPIELPPNPPTSPSSEYNDPFVSTTSNAELPKLSGALGPESCVNETQFRDDLNGAHQPPTPDIKRGASQVPPEMNSLDRAKKLCDELHAEGKHITIAMLKERRLQPNGRYEGLGNSTIAGVKSYKNKLNSALKV